MGLYVLSIPSSATSYSVTLMLRLHTYAEMPAAIKSKTRSAARIPALLAMILLTFA